MQAPTNENDGLLYASGSTVPVDTTYGYRTGCIFHHTDGAAESALYVNEGTYASCAFVPLLTTSFEIADLPDVGATAYTAGALLVADGDSYEEVAVSRDATLSDTGALTVISAYDNFDVGASGRAGTVDVFPATASKGKIILSCINNTTDHTLTITNSALNGASVTASFPAITGYVAESTAALTLAEVDVLDAVTPGTMAASKAVVADATKSFRWGAFNTGGATTDAVPFASVPNTWADGQLDVIGIFGGSSTNIGSGSSAKCLRARHIVNAATATVEHETYGLVGQLVVKDTTLGHLHAGIMGTFEGHTSGVVINGGYTVGTACVTARLGGHATITATDPIAGFLAFNNGAAALASGISAAFAASSASASYPWVLGLDMPVGSVTQAVRIGAFDGSAATTNAIPFSTAQNLWADGQLSTAEVFGSSASDLTSAYSAKCIRARHIVNVGTGNLAHETYGVMGQVVVKDTTLQHLHAGVIGTFEGYTSGVVVNGSYAYGAAAVMARVGGGAAITATKDVCGVVAFWNGAALASGSSNAFAVGDNAGAGTWTNALAVERVSNILYVPTASAYEAGVKVASITGIPDTTADGVIRISVGGTAYYIPIFAAGSITGE